MWGFRFSGPVFFGFGASELGLGFRVRVVWG